MNTSGKLTEHVKIDVAMEPISIASGNNTGGYHSMKGFKRAVFAFVAAAMADTKTVAAQVFEAKTAAAGSAAALTGAVATITSPAAMTKGLLTGNTIATASTVVTINGTVFTCEDSSPDEDAGEFASGANDTAACVNLAAVINTLLGTTILATASTTTVILTSLEPGVTAITITDAHATIIPSALEVLGYVEVDAAQLTALFSHVALKLTTDATIICAATLLRDGEGGGKAAPTQVVAASKVL